MSPTHTRKGGRLYRYYVSQSVLKQGRGACPSARVPAGEIEAAVIDQLRIMLGMPEVIVATWRATKQSAADVTEAEVRAPCTSSIRSDLPSKPMPGSSGMMIWPFSTFTPWGRPPYLATFKLQSQTRHIAALRILEPQLFLKTSVLADDLRG
jgi:hypothetical protein